MHRTTRILAALAAAAAAAAVAASSRGAALPSADAAADTIVIAAVGDTNPANSSTAGTRSGKVAASIAGANPDAVLHLGDFQYRYGTCAALVSSFDPTGWGNLMPKVIGTAGWVHDWGADVPAEDYTLHLAGSCPQQHTGESLSATRWPQPVGPGTPHWVDLGAWRIYSMPSASWHMAPADAKAATQWLDGALAAGAAAGDHPLVLWHEPYWTSTSAGHSAATFTKPWITVLDKYDVPLVLSGHQHGYERLFPMRADSTRDSATGTQQFVVGTGGIGFYAYSTIHPNSVVHQADTYGWLRMVLYPGGHYAWTFVRTGGGAFTDGGAR